LKEAETMAITLLGLMAGLMPLLLLVVAVTVRP
jgi:hypothetical protein